MSITTDYFRWQANALDADYKGSLIEKHHGDTGENRETIFRKWLIKHLPRISSPEIGGKIIDVEENMSKQIDVVLYDNRLPRFGAYHKSYYFAEGVTTAIEVKSKLDSSSLKNALKNLDSTKACKVNGARGGNIFMGVLRHKIPTGIFAYENGYSSIEKLLQALNKYKNQGISEVDFVCINKVCYIAYNRGTWENINDAGQKTSLPQGYNSVTQGEDCVWRLISGLTSEINAIITANYDFQKYFIKIPPTGSVPVPSGSPSVSPSASPSPSPSPAEENNKTS